LVDVSSVAALPEHDPKGVALEPSETRRHREENFRRQRPVFRPKNALMRVDRRTVGQPGAASSHPRDTKRSGCLIPPVSQKELLASGSCVQKEQKIGS
jgi:hypothetical protein